MKPKVYIETSVISYLTARPSRDIRVAANQQVTQEWWQDGRVTFDLYVSQLVSKKPVRATLKLSQNVSKHWQNASF